MKRWSIKLPLLLIFILTAFVSCTIDDPAEPDTDDIRDKFLGTWRFNETPAARNVDASYTVTISYDESNSSQVILRNFANAGGNFSAYGIVTSSRITIPAQEMAPGFEVEGSGLMTSSTSMNWEYTITAGGDEESFTALATK